MRLEDISGISWSPYGHYRLEDDEALSFAIVRMIQDVELCAHTVAKVRLGTEGDEENISLSDVQDGVSLIELDTKREKPAGDDYDFLQDPDRSPSDAVVNPASVSEALQSPMPLEPDAVTYVARYVNYNSVPLLFSAAMAAEAEGTEVISAVHLGSYCRYLPYPLNVFCRKISGAELGLPVTMAAEAPRAWLQR